MRMVQRRKLIVWRTPLDVSGLPQGGNLPFVHIGNYKDVVVHFIFGNVAADAAMTLQQAKNVGGGGAKALAFDKIYKVQTNAGAVEDQDKAVGEIVASTRTVANGSEDQYHFMIEFQADKLDRNNGYDCIRPALSSPAGAVLVCILVELLNPRFSGIEDDVRVMPSALDQT